MDEIIKKMQEFGVDIVIIILVSALLYVFGAKLIGWLTKLILNRINPQNQNAAYKQGVEKRFKTLRDLFVNIWRVLIVICGLFAVARLFFSDAQLAPIFASAGIIGVALGFGAQSLVRDFLSGIFIISENQYRVGDVIEIDQFSGTVERIGMRSTVLRDVEGNVHFFPSGVVQHVINKTMDYSKARLVIPVAPETNIDKASEIIDNIGKNMAQEDEWKDRIIEAPHFVMMGGLTATAVELIVSATVQPSSQWTVASEIRRRILSEFEKHSIELAVSSTGATTVLAPSSEATKPKRRK